MPIQARTAPRNKPSKEKNVIMKRSLQWMAGFASVALLTMTASAQSYGSGQSTHSGTSGSSGWGNQQSGTEPYTSQGYGTQQSGTDQYGGRQNWNQSSSQRYGMSQQSGRFCDSKSLLGQEVTTSQGQEIGTIKDIVFNPQNGEVFAVIGIGSGQNALVPAQTLNVSGSRGNMQVTANTTKENLQSGPTVQNNQWLQALNTPGFTRRIYSHFNTQSSGMGGSSSSSLSGGSSGSNSTGSSSQGQSGSSDWQQQ